MFMKHFEDLYACLGLTLFTAMLILGSSPCKVDYYDPFSEEAIKYYKILDGEQYRETCTNQISAINESGELELNLTALRKQFPQLDSIKSRPKFCYQPFYRKLPTPQLYGTSLDKSSVEFDDQEKCKVFGLQHVKIHYPYILVSLSFSDKNRSMEYQKDIGLLANFIPGMVNKAVPRTTKTEKPSVYIFVLTAMSVHNFYRHMPKTFEFLKKIKAVELLIHVTLATQPLQSIIPLLTGSTYEEIEKGCYKNEQYFNDCNFLWKDFGRNKYYTAFVEDGWNKGLFVEGDRLGFWDQPTDIYSPAWMTLSAAQNVSDGFEQCNDRERFFKTALQYTRKLIINMTMSNIPLFGVFSFNNGWFPNALDVSPMYDESFSSTLDQLYKAGTFENSFMFFVSSFGIKYGDGDDDSQGSHEVKRPFAFVTAPDWFKEQFPRAIMNLQNSAKVLSTHFDLRETMLDILNLTNYDDKGFANYSSSRAVSLFRAKWGERTCKTAEIPDQYCPCSSKSPISLYEYMYGSGRGWEQLEILHPSYT